MLVPENIIYKIDELDSIYESNKDQLAGISKDTFHMALIASESHFRHEVANCIHSKNLMNLVMKDLKEDRVKLKAKHEELKIKFEELCLKYEELKSQFKKVG